MQNQTQEKTVQEMLEEICESGDKIRKQEESKTQNENLQKADNPKHCVPYGNGSQQEKDEMEHLKNINPALYAAITSWN